MSTSDFTENKVFKEMSPEKQKFLMDFYQMPKPTSQSECIPFLLHYKSLAQKEQIHFTTEESKLLTDLLIQGLPKKEKAQVQNWLSLLQRT